MSVDAKHPQYSAQLPDWKTVRDCYLGERKVKQAAYEYLPPTASQRIDGLRSGEPGRDNYDAYLMRAKFPDYVRLAVERLIGIMHHKPPVVELPDKMLPLLERATVKGEPMASLLRRINEQQLVTGRVGVLADIQTGEGPDALPYLVTYDAESIINWDDGPREQVRQQLSFVVLDESENVRTDRFEWEERRRHRVLFLDEGQYAVEIFEEQGKVGDTVEPSIAGTRADFIPFCFINSKDVVPEPDNPPLLGLANLALSVYRSEADYRQALYMQGQDTLVIISGSGDNERVGAGAKIEVTQGGDAKYIGVSATGLPEQRKAIENDRAEAADIGGSLVDNRGRQAESGAALHIRVSARTASLNQIALSGAAGLEDILRKIARWLGLDEEQVSVKPNLDFADDGLDGRTLVDIQTAKKLGLVLSNESVHKLLRDKDMTDMEYEDELALVQKEQEADFGVEDED